MGNYPETDDRNAAGIIDTDNIVVDLGRYRQWRITTGYVINKNQPHETEAEGASERNAPVEGDHRS